MGESAWAVLHNYTSRKFNGEDLLERIQKARQLLMAHSDWRVPDNKNAKTLVNAAKNAEILTDETLERVFNVAKAVAALEGTTKVAARHMVEAIQYRTADFLHGR